MTRPDLLVLVVGTATEIGKTWVGARTLENLGGRGVSVAARKPAQSFEPGHPEPTDAAVLAAATGEHPDAVCPSHRSYPVAMAPPMAAEVLGLAPPHVAELIGELGWPTPPVQIGWLETVGGPRSPIAVDADAVVLASLLDVDLVVLVADAGLGTINAVLMSIDPFHEFELIVVLNRFDPTDDLHVRNLEWLQRRQGTREGLGVVTDTEALADVLVAQLNR